jgi:predicted porin
MNKKLIAAAIAAVVAAPAVSAADTTLYGKAHVSIQSNDNGAGDNYTVNSNASRLGVKGSEDLGDGLKAIFGYEMGYNISDGGAAGTPISARNAYVGMAGNWGTFLAGRHDTPMKIAFYAAGNDLLGDSIIDFNNIGFTERRLDNAIAYVSPSFSGFTVAAAVVPGEQSGVASAGSVTTTTTLNPAVTPANPTTTTQKGTATGAKWTSTYTPGALNNANNLNDAYSLGVMYAGGGLKAGLGYEVATKEYLGGAAKDVKTWQAGASYKFGDFQIGGQYEDTTGPTAAATKFTTWGVAGKANFGNNYVVVNGGEKDPTGANNTTTTFGVAVGHTFSKRTQVYAAYSNQDVDGTAVDPSSLLWA